MKRITRRHVALMTLVALSADGAFSQDVASMASNAQSQAAVAQQNAADVKAYAEAQQNARIQQQEIKQQYASRIAEAETQLARAKNELANCAIQQKLDEAAAKAQAAQAQGQQMQNALQQAAGPIGKLADGALSGAGAEKKDTQKAIERLGGDAKTELNISNVTKSSDLDGKCSDGKFLQDCGNATNPVAVRFGGGPDKAPACAMMATRRCRDIQDDLAKKEKDLKGANHMTSDLVTGALTVGVAALGYGLQANLQKKANEAGAENSKLQREMCENAANLAINEAQKQLALLQNNQDEALVLASLNPNFNPTNPAGGTTSQNGGSDVLVDPGTAGGGISFNGNGLGPQGGLSPALPPTGGAAGTTPSGGAPMAASPATSGGAAPGDNAWTFGSGQNGGPPNGIPLQADAGSYGGETGGGGFFGGPPANGTAGGGGGPLILLEDEEGGSPMAGFGDGGLNVLLSKMRQRLAAHGPELRRSVDLSPMARAGLPAKEAPRGLATQN